MKTIIAGSRTVTDPAWLNRALAKCGWTPTVVLSGCARGADYLGEAWALEHKIPLDRYPADWNRNGRAAGHIRNDLMAAQAEALIALWDGASAGTRHIIERAQIRQLRVHVERTVPHTPRVYSRLSGPVAPPDAVYIGRPSKWGNPFVIGKHGDRAAVIERYRQWIVLQPELYQAARVELRGRDLVCFCSPEACHGDILLEIANG